MFLSQIHSPANPFQGSAFSTYGYKPAADVMAFSVGDAGDYSTNMPNGDAPTVSISGGILTFSCPQTNPNMGIGDLVLTGLWNVYITGKISTRQWIVRTKNGYIPDDKSSIMLIDVRKAYSTLEAAFDVVGGMGYKIGSYDLVDKRMALYVPCYSKSSYSAAAIDITGWTTSPACHIKVYTPTDVRKECNSSQRHNHLYGGFFIESTAVSSLITCSSDNIWIDGLSLKETGACNIGIEVQGSGIVSNCIFDGFATDAIKVNEAVDEVQLINNLAYGGSDVGLAANATTKLVNNTVYGYATGYEFTSPGAGVYAANNIAANNTTDFGAHAGVTLYNCSSDDASAGTSNGCVSSGNTTRGVTKFYDTTADDYRITNANDPKKIQTGLDLRAVSPYFVTHDCANNPNDDTASMGALHLVPHIATAIGDTSTDIKTGAPTMSISDGVVTFSVAQTNDLLAAGCIIMPGSIILTEKIDSTNWRSTLATGLAPADDAGPTAITSIKPQFDSVFASWPTDGDLVSYDIAWKVLCVEATATSMTSVAWPGTLTADETRNIQVFAPESGSYCNSNRRHAGVWDGNLMYIKSILTGELGYVYIEGLQLGADDSVDAIDARNEFTSIKQCIIKEAAGGIVVRPKLNTHSRILIANNVIYDCDDEGIKLENTSSGTESHFGVYNNTVYNCLNGISFDGLNGSNTNVVRLVNNLCILNQKDIVGDGPRTPLVTSESNWTSDVSGFALDLDRNNDIFKTVRFVGTKNFHIPLYQHLSMSAGYMAASDHLFQVSEDIDSTARPTSSYWDIGADQYSIPTKSIAFFSVGLSTSDLQNDPGMSVSVTGSIATFGEALDSDIGIGDKVTLITNGPLYLAEKGSSTVWRVVDNQGAAVSDFSGDTLVDIKRVSNALNDATSTDVESELNFGANPKNLVLNTTEVNVECYQDGSLADTTAVSVSGWTADADYPFRVHVPFDLLTQCGRRQRHIGVWSGSYYHLDVNGDAIAVSDEHIYFDGLQVDPTNNKGFDLATADGVQVERCLIRDCSYGVYQDANTYSISVIANTIYNSSAVGIRLQNGLAYNNTVVSDSGTLIDNAAAGTIKNNLGQGSATNYVNAGTMDSCISEDATATGTNCKTNASLDFRDTNDYHLARDDFEAINYGAEDSYTPSLDIDSSVIVTPSIGSHCPNFATITQCFSCGKTTGSFSSSGLKVSIVGTIAEFSDDISNELVMVGDKLTYDVDSKVAYLKEKISTKSWVVVNHLGVAPTAVSNKDVVSIKRSFNDLEDLFDSTKSTSISQFYGDSSNPFTSLENGKMNIKFSIGSEQPYNDPITMSGFNCDAQNHFTLFAPYDLLTECNRRHKHEGIYEADRSALLWSSASTDTEMLSIACAYTEVNGLIVRSIGPSGTKHAIHTSVAGCKIVNNILYNAERGVSTTPANLRTVIVNNIIYSCRNGIVTSLKDYILNNTIVGATWYGIDESASPLSVMVNNILQDCTLGCFNVGGTVPEYCLTDDGTATGEGCLTQVLTFVNKTAKNYALAKSDARGKGIQFAAYPAWSYSTDAIEVDRGSFWDMGALEYQPTKKLYISIGDSTDHKISSGGGPLSITVDADSIGTFNAPQTSEKIISGDKISAATGESFQLGEKIDSSTWYVTQYNGDPAPAGTYTVNSIGRYLSNLYYLSYVLNSNLGSSNLVTKEVQVNVTIPKDDYTGTYGASLVFNCDVDYFIRIFAPIDTTKHCNVSQRHKGKYVSGEGATLNVTSDNYVIKAASTDFLEVSGLVLICKDGIDAIIGIDDSAGFVIDSNIIRNTKGGAVRGIVDSVTDGLRCIIVNNTMYECLVHGIHIGGSTDNAVWVMNNTIIACGNGLRFAKESSGDTMVYSYNNIFQDSLHKDSVEDNISNTGKFISQYNIGSDESVGTAGHNFNNTALEFLNKAAEDFDLDPETDSIAIDSGLDMQVTSPYYYATDIRGIDRESLFWDRGALERNENIGDGSMDLGPLYMTLDIGIVTDEAPTTILYLRETKDAPVPENVQFTHIEKTSPTDSDAINWYLEWNDIDNIVIYVEAGWTPDPGTFALNDRGGRSVTIMTDPTEIVDYGPASLVYGEATDSDGLVDDASSQESLTFENLLIYSQADQNADYLITAAANTDKMIFVNCIIQLNQDAITDAACVVELINSYVLYFNKNDSSILYLVKNAITGHVNFNSVVMSESADAETFQMCSGSLTDYINNCLSYNHGSGSMAITAPGRKILCIENTDPLLTELESNWSGNVSTIMTQSDFQPLLESPLINNGNDSNTQWQSYDIETDILGRSRIFEFSGVDIGPYEAEVHIFDITGADIRSIDQVKIEIDRVNKRCVSLTGDLVYQNLFDTFQYNQDELEEFLREEKIAIELKRTERQFLKKTDKVNTLLAEFDAYYDSQTHTILVTKIGGELSWALGQMLKDDAYVLHFDEQEHTLSLYLNEVSTLGLCGVRNPIKNVRFGGNPIFNG